MKFVVKNLNIDFLSDFSENWKFSAYDYSIDSKKNNITVFCAKTEGDNTLQADWESIADAINNYYLVKINNEFELWNSYLIFVVNNTINKDGSIRQKIENDKFYMRKIVEYNDSPNIEQEEMIGILNKRLLASDVQELLNVDSNTIPAAKTLNYKSSLIEDDIPFDAAGTSKEKRKQWILDELDKVRDNEDK